MFFTEIKKILDKLHGKIGVYYKDLTSGKSFGFNENEGFLAASVIKLPILVAVLHEINNGGLRKDDIIKLSTDDKVPGCGALAHMHSGLDVTIKDLYKLMIILSDNTATNMLIKVLGIQNINSIMKEFGLNTTKLNRFLFDDEQQMKGIENYFSPSEIGVLLEDVYRKKIISQDICQEIEEILKLQQINSKIPYLIPDNIEIAHKTGEDEGITHDVGIVYSKNPFILCFAANNTDVVIAEEAMRKISLMCYGNSLL
ncbi:MAG: serine hydrolase [Clostridiales bacterium]|jgi:beta-lactamase class A|nr:serine hydrolase [Clostridiales bacterium]